MSAAERKRSASPEGTERLGAALAPSLRAGDVLALSGELGAGKTRFVAGLVHAFRPGARVRSPSFRLINEYPGSPPLVHLDLYRLAEREVDGLGLEEYAERAILAVEWGERLPRAWREQALALAIVAGEGDERTLTASAEAGRGHELLAAWRALPEAW